MLFMIMKSDINKYVCIMFEHLSSIILENFKDRDWIILEILELIELHTFKETHSCIFNIIRLGTRHKQNLLNGRDSILR